MSRISGSLFPHREEPASDYPIPIYADDYTAVFFDVNELLVYLKENTTEAYAVYWQNRDDQSSYQHAMIFHTNDRKMIVGASVTGKAFESHTVEAHLEMGHFLSATIGCMTVEEPPPENSPDFIAFCRKRFVP